MTELVINLKKLKESDIFVEEYLLLALIYNGEDISSYKFINGEMEHLLLALEDEMWVSKVDGEYVLRSKALALFEEEKSTVTFEEFWNKYHEVTFLPKTDRSAAETKWRRLKPKEQVKAIEMIQSYYDSLNDKKYCRKARTYLENKNFNDEFINNISQRRVVAR